MTNTAAIIPNVSEHTMNTYENVCILEHNEKKSVFIARDFNINTLTNNS